MTVMVPEAYDCQDGEACMFPEVEIGDDQQPDSVLREGMKVLLPCVSCGATPRDHLDWQEHTLEETEAALNLALSADPLRVLYHWAPTERRGQITRWGLRPSMRGTTSPDPRWRAPWVCLATDPNWAWQLSGGQRGAQLGSWDLWLTYADRLTDPYVVPRAEVNGIHEVRTKHRVYKRHLVFVGERVTVKQPGEPAKLYIDTSMRVVEGDYIRTKTGRTYLITSVRTATRGAHAGTRQHLETVVMAPDHETEPDARIIQISWYSRNRSNFLPKKR